LGDGLKVEIMINSNNFKCIPHHALGYNPIPCFVHSMETLKIKGFKGRGGNIWFIIMASMRLDTKLPMAMN
jgi:hypothetical protein